VTGSTCTPASRSGATIGSGSSSSAAISFASRSRRSGSPCGPTARVLVTLKTPWRDGTTHLRFAPMTLLERLAALTPRPRINVLIYHGILAPRAALRAAAVAYGRTDRRGAPVGDAARTSPPVDVPTPYEPTAGNTTRGESVASVTTATGVPAAAIPGRGRVSREPADLPAGAPVSRHWNWAELLQRVFAVDVLAARAGAATCG
jgi:hypothetical protein